MADQEALKDWPIEEIPQAAKLYMRVHLTFITDGDLDFRAFRDQGSGMSTEWEKYATPAEVRDRGRKPAENAVIEMTVSDILEIATLQVQHSPNRELGIRGHTDVNGKKLQPYV